MGVDAVITLPAAARLQDVADVLGALAGLPMEKRHFDPPHAGWSAQLHAGSLKIEAIGGMVECARILLDSGEDKRLVDGERYHHCMYHFEGGKNGERLLMPPSSAFWIAIGTHLVEFFGGTVDFNDCDDSDNVDFVSIPRLDIHAEDGDEWYRFQERKLAVGPLTPDDLLVAATVAAYKPAQVAK